MQFGSRRALAAAKRAHQDVMHRLRWRRSPAWRVTREFTRQYPLRVQAGPFRGMVYPRFAVGRGELVVAQLLGAYEQELAEVMRRVIDEGYDTIVDIGASDGYYAVGLATRSAGSKILAFEMNPFPARVCRALAQANGVEDRLEMRGECTVSELAARPPGRTFVLSDCEGGEGRLIDPETAPWLLKSTLLVELHERAVPGVTALITQRFEATHDIALIDSEPRYIGDYPALEALDNVTYVDRELALSEFRPSPMRWAFMVPRTLAPG